VGFVAGTVFFGGEPVALSGERSVGVTAAVVAGVAAVVAFSTGYVRSVVAARPRPLPAGVRWRVGLDVTALTVTAAVVVVLLTGTIFAVLQLAFREFQLDPVAASLVVGVAAAIAAYVVTGAAAQMTTRAVASLLAMFLVSGGLASMLSAHDPYWWQVNFSALGGGDGFSSYTFNITIVFAGLVVVTLTQHLTHDIQARSEVTGPRQIRVLRVWLVAVGLLLAGVGLVAVDEAEVLHTVIAATMSIAFAGLVIASPFLVPWLPRSFRIASGIVVAGFGLVAFLMWPVGYFNLTAVELLGSVLLLTWLVLFVRAVAAAIDDDTDRAIADHGDVETTRA
jgi:hypothetical protein